MELGSSYLDTSLNESSSQPSAPPAGAFDNDDWTNVLQPLAEASQRAHQLHASTSQNLLDPPLVPESAVGDPLLDGGEPRLSNARMSKKPKPRQPAPEGVTVTDKSCARCRLRKVRCNRVFPKCDHCTARKEDCDLKDWKPKPKVKPTDPARVAELERRLAELEEQVARGGPAAQSFPACAVDFPLDIAAFRPQTALPASSSLDAHVAGARSIGPRSLDWRLAEPQMASSLSRHLCHAFSESCCSLLPSFEYFIPRMADFYAETERLSATQKVALTTFCAIGARTSPHSAVLGISLAPQDTLEHPNVPLLNAGTRRQNACTALFDKAHAENYESSTLTTATIENLATLLALLQLCLFAEPLPIKSRPLLRSALSHYRELQDEAETDEQRATVRSSFGFAIYTADCLISAQARRKCHISDDDLRLYFSRDTRIVVPRLPTDDLRPVVDKVLAAIPTREAGLKTAKHLLACWVCACQRLFVQIVAPSMAPTRSVENRVASLAQLWTGIDTTRTAVEYLLGLAPPQPGPAHPPSGDTSEQHHALHEYDYGAQIVRLDRDLLDLVNLIHAHLADKRARDLPLTCLGESLRRVRRALKRRAAYLKCYISGADAHMTFHELLQLELLPNWTQLVLQRVGEPGGPETADEEVTENELGWFVEGLQHACYYHPGGERRLNELAPRLSSLGGRLNPASQRTSTPSPLAPLEPALPALDPTQLAVMDGSTWSGLDPLPASGWPPDPFSLPDFVPPTAPLGFSPSLGAQSYPGDAPDRVGVPLPPLLDPFDALAPLAFGGEGGLDGFEREDRSGRSPEWASRAQ